MAASLTRCMLPMAAWASSYVVRDTIYAVGRARAYPVEAAISSSIAKSSR